MLQTKPISNASDIIIKETTSARYNKFVGDKLAYLMLGSRGICIFSFNAEEDQRLFNNNKQARGRELGNGRCLCVNHDRLLVFPDDFFWIRL